MKERYERETGKEAMVFSPKGMSPSREYVEWMEEKVEEIEAENDQLRAQFTWRIASELPEKGQIVIATYLNQFGKRRRVRAVYIRQYEKEEAGEDDELCVEYCEEQDEWYLKEGWYELIDNWDGYSSVAIVEGTVDYWLPMPKYEEDTDGKD